MNSIIKKLRGDGKTLRTVSVFVDDEEVTFEIPITRSNEKAIKKSWLVLKDHWKYIFAISFIRWFQKYPELKRLFRRFPKDLRVEVLQQSAAFIAHAEKFEETIELTISTLTKDPSKIVNSMIDLGRSHHYLGANKRFATSLADSVHEAIVDIAECDQETGNAWSCLLHFLIGLLKFGIATEETIVKNRKYSVGP